MIGQSHPVPVDLLRRLLRLDVETGNLYWRERPPEMFSGGAHSKKQEAKRWNGRHAGRQAMTAKNSRGYFHGPILGRWYRAHQVVFALSNGRWPDDWLDHINHDRGDNRPKNLREVGSAGNARNISIRSDNTSGHLGVNFKKSDNRWVARICCGGKRIYLGAFDTIEEAIDARKAAEKLHNYHENHGSRAA